MPYSLKMTTQQHQMHLKLQYNTTCTLNDNPATQNVFKMTIQQRYMHLK